MNENSELLSIVSTLATSATSHPKDFRFNQIISSEELISVQNSYVEVEVVASIRNLIYTTVSVSFYDDPQHNLRQLICAN